ncbi:MAG: mechanosensitive ion channel [Candidatus Gracilibacteria bacterium]|nr:mechanosensitive ion channel [Candidatus Gracilibacteria bacterium]MDD2908988.1 mechanosensitive ion channel [Candidatus Gracilibacteria bacterium]
MKTRLIIGIILLISFIAGYFYFKDLLLAVTFIQPKYINGASIVISSIIITYITARIIDIIFLKAFNKFLKQDSLGKKLLPLVHNIIIIFVRCLGIVTTINLLGFNITTILTGAGIGGIVLALAGKEVASNLFGSLSLIFSKKFKPGDIIRIKGLEGTVEEITLTYTRLTDTKGVIVYVPNKNITTENIENLSQGKHRKHEIILPLPINILSKDINAIIKNLEKYGDKKIKDKVFENYKVSFDSLTSTQQNISFKFQTDLKSNINIIKREVYLDFKDLLDKEKIVF